MSIAQTKKYIENLGKEFDAITGVSENPDFDPSQPEGPENQREIIGEFSCERIQLLIDKEIARVTEIIISKAESASELMSTWAPILSVPSNPLKIIKWAIKVATGPAAQAVAMAIQQIIELAQLIGAIASLAGAIAGAVSKLAACIQGAIFDAINDVINTLLQSAANLMQQAEQMVDNVIDQALQDSGVQDLLDDIDAAKEGIGSAVDNATDDVVQAGINVQNARTSISRTGVKLSNYNPPTALPFAT